MSPPSPTIIERVKKLRRLAQSSNEHEASSADETARALMQQYQITDDDLADDTTEIVESHGDAYHADLARVIAVWSKTTLAINKQRFSIAFRGRPREVRLAALRYRMLAREADVKCEMSTVGDPPTAARAAWRICFWFGFVGAVEARLKGEKRPTGKGARTEKPAPPVQEALEAFQALSEQLAPAVPDVRAVIETLKQKAYDAGRTVGNKAWIGSQDAFSLT